MEMPLIFVINAKNIDIKWNYRNGWYLFV